MSTRRGIFSARRGGRGGGYGNGPGGGGGGPPTSPFVGLQNFSATDYMATAGNAGEPGVATGFGIATLHQLPALSAFSSNHTLVDRSSGATGWVQYYGNGPIIGWGAVSGAAAFTSSSTRLMLSSDVGRLFLHVGVHTGAGGFVRSYLDRVEQGVGTAIAGYTPATSPQQLAKSPQFSPIPGVCPIVAHICFRGVPTLAQIQDLYDRVRALGDLPNTVLGATVTHRWSLRDELAGTTPVTGQTAPAQLTDRITLAGADALLRNGAPTVKVIDTSIDGRRMMGVQGGSATNYLNTTGGVRGAATGFWAHLLMRPDQGIGLVTMINMTGGAVGWQLYTAFNGGAHRFAVAGASTFATATSANFNTQDLGRVHQFQMVYDGTTAFLYLHRVLIASAAVTGGGFIDGGLPQLLCAGTGYSIFGFQGGSGYVPTLAELQQAWDDTDRTGRISPIPGTFGAGTNKTQHLYDLKQDITAGPVDTVPLTVLDRIGTDHLTKVGIDVPKVGPNGILGVGPYAFGIDSWISGPGAGIQGVDAGLHVVVDLYLTRVPTVIEALVTTMPASQATGFYLIMNSATLFFRVFAGGTQRVTSGYTLTATDLNKRLRVVANMNATNIQIWLNGVQVGADVARGGTYVPTGTALPMYIAQNVGNNQTLVSGWIELVEGGNTFLTPAEIATLSADLTQPAPVVPTKTQKRWRFEQDVAGTGMVPLKSVERVSGGDDLMRIGSGLTIAQRVDRVWSYETSPILAGINGFTDTDYYGSTDPVTGNATGCWFGVPLVIESQAVASQTRALIGKGTASAGWGLSSAGTNSTLTSVLINGSGSPITGPSIVIAAADVGKQLLLIVSWDGAKIHAYLKRVESGTGNAMVGFTPALPGDNFRIGRGPVAGAQAASSVRILGIMGGNGIPSLAEVQAAHDAFLAYEDLKEIPGKTDYLISVKQDVIDNGGTLPNVLTNRKGAGGVTKAGNPLLALIYGRAAAW